MWLIVIGAAGEDPDAPRGQASELRRLSLKLVASLRHHGPRATIAQLRRFAQRRVRHYREGAVDRRYGTDSGGYATLAELSIDSPNVEHGVHFEPVTRTYFDRMLAAAGLDEARYTFVDLGCGKGRALLFAAEHPFARLVGVEFSVELAAAARENVRRYLAATGEADRFEIRHEDAAGYRFPGGPLAIFLYNPFREAVLTEVVANLRAALAAEPREVAVLYRTPDHADVLDALPFLELGAAEKGFRIYRSRATASL